MTLICGEINRYIHILTLISIVSSYIEDCLKYSLERS